MTYMATGYELLFESASKVNNSKYLIGLSSLGALSEARVIMSSCLGCSCSSSRIDVGVESTSERVFALLRGYDAQSATTCGNDVLVLRVGCGNSLNFS
ncbi:hypothetical protein COP1_034847 [Malus domestica]